MNHTCPHCVQISERWPADGQSLTQRPPSWHSLCMARSTWLAKRHTPQDSQPSLPACHIHPPLVDLQSDRRRGWRRRQPPPTSKPPPTSTTTWLALSHGGPILQVHVTGLLKLVAAVALPTVNETLTSLHRGAPRPCCRSRLLLPVPWLPVSSPTLVEGASSDLGNN